MSRSVQSGEISAAIASALRVAVYIRVCVCVRKPQHLAVHGRLVNTRSRIGRGILTAGGKHLP